MENSHMAMYWLKYFLFQDIHDVLNMGFETHFAVEEMDTLATAGEGRGIHFMPRGA